MGVYIKGMEMPTRCLDCIARRDVDIGVGIADGCELLKVMIYDPNERLDDCPLVSVPPYVRLIDINALKLAIANNKHDYLIGFLDELINNAPTVIPADEDGEI